MRKHLLGLAITIPLATGAAHAATVLTLTAGTYLSDPAPFPSPFQGYTGTLYITGTGDSVVTTPNFYQEQVSVEGAGLFAGFDGLATYTVRRHGQLPSVTIQENINGIYYLVSLDTTEPIPNFVFDGVFTEDKDPGSASISGRPFNYVNYDVSSNSNGTGGYFATNVCTQNSPCDSAGSYSLISNNQIVAPTPQPVTTAVPEPASWALMAGGLCMIGMLARRRGQFSV